MATGLDPTQLLADLPDAIKQVGELSRRQRLREAELCADLIACAADALWAVKKPHRTEPQPTAVYDAIKFGAAILAHRAGGVTFGGLHWCSTSHGGCAPGEWVMPESASRSVRGAFFTPRSLAEEVTVGALEDLVFEPGPCDTADKSLWRIKPAADILRLKVGDIAVGSGVFLIAACRYLGDRLIEAWHVEAGQVPQRLHPFDPMTLAARRLVMRCLYGVDIDATSVELCRLSLALMAPLAPLDLTDRVVCGDSLLGITSLDQLDRMSLDQLDRMSLDPNAPLRPVMDPKLVRLLSQLNAHMREEAA